MSMHIDSRRNIAPMATLRIRFRELLEAKAEQEGETRITLQQVSADTNLAHNTLTKWARGQVDRIDVPTLITLCEYFGVKPGELLELTD
jgi:DNA-binding Xre family transcriptional regulator